MTIQVPFTVDLDRPIEPKNLKQPLYYDDEYAHELVVTVTRGANTVDLTGATPVLYVIHQDTNETFSISSPNVAIDQNENNVVRATLTPAVYATTGPVTLALQVAKSSVVSTLLCVYGTVRRTKTGTVIDGGGTQVNLTAILGLLQDLNNPVVTVSGSTPTINAVSGKRYVCGEVSTLTVNTTATGCVDVIFTSGSTPTVLTVTPPSGSVHWPGWFDAISLEANHTYEISILDGVYAAVMSWT